MLTLFVIIDEHALFGMIFLQPCTVVYLYENQNFEWTIALLL